MLWYSLSNAVLFLVIEPSFGSIFGMKVMVISVGIFGAGIYTTLKMKRGTSYNVYNY